jgi:hypothetical protein
MPPVHDAVALGRVAQAVPHAPQCAVSVCVLVSQPLLAMPSQLAKGAVHAPTVQVPLVHAAMALGTLQRLPQAPHAAMELWVSTQAPSQQVCAEGQGRSVLQPMTQTLPTQSVPAAQ